MKRKPNKVRPKKVFGHFKPYSQGAYDQIIKPNTILIMSIAGRFRKILPDADNTVQEIHLKILKNADTIDATQSITGWVAKVATRVCQDLARKEKRQTTLLLSNMPELVLQRRKRETKSNSRANGTKNKTRLGHIMLAANDLTPDKKEVFVRHAILGRTFEQISRDLRVPTGTVKARYSHALKNIRKKLGLS